MTAPERIREHLYDAIRAASREVAGDLDDSLKLVDELGISSLRAAMILMNAAKEAGIPLAEIEFTALETVGDLVSCFSRAGR